MRHPRFDPLWHRALVLCVGLAAAGCNGPSTPTWPTRLQLAPAPAPGPVQEPPPGPPISVLAIRAVTIYGNANSLTPAIRLVETGGLGDALVTSVTFNLADGIRWSNGILCSNCSPRVKAGGEVSILTEVDQYGDYPWSFSVPSDYTGRLEVVVSYQDEEGRRGSVRELVPLPWVK
jgi:hypothetical protein